MGYAEFLVEVQVPDCELCEFTEDRDEVSLLIASGRDGDEPADEIQVTVFGDPQDADDLEKLLQDLAGSTRGIRRNDEAATFDVEEIEMTSLQAVYPTLVDICGQDVIFQPSLARAGWLAVPFLASAEGHPAELVQTCQKQLDADGVGFRLVRFEDFEPDEFVGPLDPLTDKQLEVVRVAYSMGYYETPRHCTLEDMAEVFGISKAAVHMRLRTAERKIIEELI